MSNRTFANLSLAGPSVVAVRLIFVAAATTAGAGTAVAERPDIVWMAGGHTESARAAGFSAEGETLVSIGGDGTAKLWRVADGALLRTFAGEFSTAAVSPDGHKLATATDDTAQVWRISDGRLLGTFTRHAGSVRSLAFSPDGQILAAGLSSRVIDLWRLADGELLRTLTGHADITVWDIAFSADGLIAAAGARDIPIWRVADGELLRTMTGHTNRVLSVAFAPDGQTLASGSRDTSVMIWRVADGAMLRTLSAQPNEVPDVTFSPDGQTLFAGTVGKYPEYAGYVHQWRAADGELLRTIPQQYTSPYSLVVSPDGTVLACGGTYQSVPTAPSLRLWQIADAILLRDFIINKASITAVACAPDESIVATATGRPDSSIRLWRVADGALLETIWYHEVTVGGVAFSPDSKTMAWGFNAHSGAVWLTPVAHGGLSRVLRGGASAAVHGVAFSPDGLMVAAGNGYPGPGTLKLWKIADPNKPRTLWYHDDTVGPVAFSPDGALLAAGSNNGVLTVWRITDGALLMSREPHFKVRSVAFSPDAQMVVSTGDDAIKFWRVSDGELLRTIVVQTLFIPCVAFAPDGQTLISTSFDSTVDVWRAADGALLRRYDQDLGSGATFAQYGGIGRYFAYGRSDATLVLARNPYYRSMPGDADCSGDVTSEDIAPFVSALQGRGTYYAQYPDCNWHNADCNGDDEVNFADINPFLKLLH